MTILSIPCLRCRATAQADENAPGVACPSCGLALPPPATAAWMVSRDGGQPFGPYTIAQLAAHFGQRQILPTDSLWHQGAPGWVQAGQLPALTAGAPVVPQPAPQPQPQPYGGQPPPYGQPPYGGQPYGGIPGQPYGAPSASVGIGTHIKRAFDWNLRAIVIEPGERQLLLANGVDEDNASKFLIWRRSVLLAVAPVTAITALLALIGAVTSTEWSVFTAVGVIAEILPLLALFAMPVTAWLAAQIWYRHRRSRTILLRGWLIAFVTPLVLGLIPYTWRIPTMGGNPQQAMQVSVLGALVVYVTLMPAVLSLIPGVLRGCLRLKALLPQSSLPGWFLIAATPLYILLFLVVFTTINQVMGNLLLLLGVLALLGAPVLYLVHSRVFTRPLEAPEDIAKIGSVQNTALAISGAGLLLIVIYAFTVDMFGRSLIGVSDATSLIRPWDPDLLRFPIEYIARSLFTTVLVADLIMLMNLSLWRDDKAFAGAHEAAAHYDRMMSEIEEAGAPTEVRYGP